MATAFHRATERFALLARVLAAAILLLPAAASGDEPLHARIDQLVEQSNTGPQAPLANDAEFLRRVSLDLIGVPPTPDDLRAFLADGNPDKRTQVVDRLLQTPAHARQLTIVLDTMLMERRPPQHVTADEWQQYLLKSVQDNKPYNQLAREILSADGVDPALRPAAAFSLSRGSEPNLLTRDVGRIFFGRDLQCAQCHDHPLIEDYHQADYHGLFAFLAGGFAFTAPDPDKKTYYAEKAGSDVAFESVFIRGTKHLTGPRMPGGVQLDEPWFAPGEEYQVAPADKVRPVPKFSRRAKLAEEATNGRSREFNENIANRLWAAMMGRGLVHPVDLHHPSNPPSHPELLRLLGEEFAAMRFDLRRFLRELALTRTYQRSIDTPPDLLSQMGNLSERRTAMEQQREPLTAAVKESQAAYEQAMTAWRAAEEALLPIAAERDQAKAKCVEALKKLEAAQKAVADAQAQQKAKQEAAAAVAEAAAKAQEAVKKVPGDQELAQAAQKFTDRGTQLANEAAALGKAVEEKTAALTAPQQEAVATRQALEAVQAKYAPVAANLRQTEQAMVAARTKTADARRSVNALTQRLESLDHLGQYAELETKARQATEAIPAIAAEVDAARKTVAEATALVAQRESEQKSVTTVHAAAAEALAAARKEQQRRQELVQSVAAAAMSAESARQKLPDDAVLTEAAAKLKQRQEQLQTEAAEQQKQVETATTAEKTAADQLAAATAAMQAAVQERTSREQVVKTAEEKLKSAQEQLQIQRASQQQALVQLTSDWTVSHQMASLKPLSPEQLCWSIFQVTGILDRYRQAEIAELNKTSPLSEEAQKDPAQVAARERELERRVFDKLKGNIAQFAQMYAAAAGQPQGDFFATADQALFAANGGSIQSWVAPAGGNIAERLVNQPDPRKAAEDLYLTVLSRPPTEDEVADVTAYFAARPNERAACAQELLWGLIASAEFRFNH